MHRSNILPYNPVNEYSFPSMITQTLHARHEESDESEIKSQPREHGQEVTWLFFRDNTWSPFESENHWKIEQAFTLGGIYVDIKDRHFPQLKTIRVFPTRFYLSYLGMKYRLSCVIQG
ncbi:hypothetical protein J3Q64DRAFT_1779832 [Phycomyces blakesleeanus]|uniref:WWE domain-containing protein n=1 Tax=Phycomyces blakesleeanus TaxID=4837 RepID=A0ABR3AHZ9_PHYBL